VAGKWPIPTTYAGAEHLGFSGYFVFEAKNVPGSKGISVLGKAASLEAAFRLIDIWADKAVAA
jgi:hypothetical protein